MKTLEIKYSNLTIEESEGKKYLKRKSTVIEELDDEQYKILEKIFDINEYIKPYSHAVLRKKFNQEVPLITNNNFNIRKTRMKSQKSYNLFYLGLKINPSNLEKFIALFHYMVTKDIRCTVVFNEITYNTSMIGTTEALYEIFYQLIITNYAFNNRGGIFDKTYANSLQTYKEKVDYIFSVNDSLPFMKRANDSIEFSDTKVFKLLKLFDFNDITSLMLNYGYYCEHNSSRVSLHSFLK